LKFIGVAVPIKLIISYLAIAAELVGLLYIPNYSNPAPAVQLRLPVIILPDTTET
jgi:hypothetical protein